MTLTTILHYAALVAGYLLAFARLTDKARPLWSFLPAKLQPFLPAVLVVLPDLAAGLQGGKTVEDLLSVLLTAGGAFLVAMRGAVPAAHYEQLSPSAKKEIAAARGSDKLPPGLGGAAALLLASCLALGGGAACSNGASPITPASVISARDQVRMGYSVGAVVLTKLSEVHKVWAGGLEHPTAADADVDRVALAGLHAMNDALTVVRAWLETGEGEAVAKKKLREALDSAALLADLAPKMGVTLPAELLDGLKVARAALGGAS